MAKSDPIDFKLVEQLANLLSESDLTEIEVEHEAVRIKVSREIKGATTVVQAPQAMPVAAAAPVAAPTASVEAAPPQAATASSGHALNSPMVGTAYLAPEPGAPVFVSVGDKVTKGQTVLIIEAMKTMNQIAADRDGIVSAIMIDDAQPVEYGEPLLIID